MKAVQVDDVGPIREVCSLPAAWTGVNAAAASFLSTFSHTLFSYLTCDMSFIPPTPHPPQVASKRDIPQTILDSKESLWSELQKALENISAQLSGTTLKQSSGYFFFLVVL